MLRLVRPELGACEPRLEGGAAELRDASFAHLFGGARHHDAAHEAVRAPRDVAHEPLAAFLRELLLGLDPRGAEDGVDRLREPPALEDVRGALVGELRLLAAKADVDAAEVLRRRHLAGEPRDDRALVDRLGEASGRGVALGADVEEGSLAGDELELALAAMRRDEELARGARRSRLCRRRALRAEGLGARGGVRGAERDGGELAEAVVCRRLELTRGLLRELGLAGEEGGRAR